MSHIFAGVDTPSVFENRHEKHNYNANNTPSANARRSATPRSGRRGVKLADPAEDVLTKKEKPFVPGTGADQYLRHISLSQIEYGIVGLILLVFLFTILFQFYSGKFKFQLFKQVTKLRGGKQFQE